MKTSEPSCRRVPPAFENVQMPKINVTRDQSVKADGGKPRMELIPTSAFNSLGRVLGHGAEKYGDHTWPSVDTERYVGALLRHLCAFLDDPTGVDADSGLYHTEHLLANATFINDAVIRGRVRVDDEK